MIPYGEAAAVGGAALNSIGQMQGARGLAAALSKQQAQQMGIQKEADAATGAMIGNFNPALMDERNTAAAAAPGQAYLQTLSGYKPIGLGAAANDFTASSQAGGNQNMAANILAARSAGQEQTRRGMAAAAGNLEDTRSTLQEKSRRLAALYGLDDTLAASKGAGLRATGNLLQVAGGVAGGAEGMSGGQSRQKPNPATYDPAYAL